MIDRATEFIASFSGPEFLVAFALYWAAVLATSLGLRHIARGISEPAVDVAAVEAELTNPYEIAYLRGGLEEVILCAVAWLEHLGILKIDGRNLTQGRKPAVKDSLGAVENAVLDACSTQIEGHQLLKAEWHKRDLGAFERRARARLRRLHLLMPPQVATKLWLVAVAAAAAVLLPGGYRLLRGIGLGRPIGFLMIELAVFVPVLLYVCRPPRATLAAKHVLAHTRQQYSFLGEGLSKGMRLEPVDTLLATAVFGATGLKAAFAPPPSSSSSSSSSSGCGGGSSCGGGGCGGGGCGG